MATRFGWFLSVCSFVAVSAMASAAAGQTANRALLVGVSTYPNLAPRWQLEGPVNDVERFRELLLAGRLATFDPANITVLSGWPSRPAGRPTRENIAKEFARLAEVSQKGDQVVILLAGHGSQQPAARDSADEPDGLDEIFLPADARRWDGQTGALPVSIIDNEIGQWLKAIRAKGAFVWAIFDTCHSGTMTRGTERQRGMPPTEFIDDAMAFMNVRSRGAAGAATESGSGLGLAAGDDGLVALYAVQASQTTPELRLPANGKWHGLFTYTLAELLTQATEPMSYRELMARVAERYRSYPRFDETPAFEGGGADRGVLGSAALPDRPPFVITATFAGEGPTLAAGTIHGFGPGAILALYPPAGEMNGQQVVGYVRVVSADAVRASIEPVAHDGRPAIAATDLKPGVRARLVSRAMPDAVLRVGNISASPLIASAVSALERSTDGAAVGGRGADGAEWIVVSGINGEVWLVHQSESDEVSASGRPDTTRPAGELAAGGRRVFVAPSADQGDLAERLSRIVSAIARAEGLRRLAAPENAGAKRAIRLETSAFVFDGAGGAAPRKLEAGPGGRVLRAGEQVEFRVRNTGKETVDLSVLFLDAAFGITPLYPKAGREMDTRLAAGREIVVGRFPVTADTIGNEDLLVVGLPASTPPVNLSILQQPALTVASTAASRGVGRSGLSALLRAARKGSRDLGADVSVSDGELSVSIFSWRTVAAPAR